MVEYSDNVAYLRVTGGRNNHARLGDVARGSHISARTKLLGEWALCTTQRAVSQKPSYFSMFFSQRYGYMLYEDFEIYSSCEHRANIVQMRAAAQQ
jgi:hypothetical protein